MLATILLDFRPHSLNSKNHRPAEFTQDVSVSMDGTSFATSIRTAYHRPGDLPASDPSSVRKETVAAGVDLSLVSAVELHMYAMPRCIMWWFMLHAQLINLGLITI